MGTRILEILDRAVRILQICAALLRLRGSIFTIRKNIGHVLQILGLCPKIHLKILGLPCALHVMLHGRAPNSRSAAVNVCTDVHETCVKMPECMYNNT